MSGADRRFSLESLQRWTGGVLRTAGVNADDAAQTARMLIQADARGFRTHGLTRLPSYVEKLESGEFNPQATLDEIFVASFGIVEANRALGQIAGPFAVDRAVRRTAHSPVAVYILRDTGHLGALGTIVLPAAQAGRVAVIFQATPPVIGLPGATGPMLGNNPLALAAPRPDGPPIVVDIACSVAARGNILMAARAGNTIPEGWALDDAGQPTTDASRALVGTLLAFGGHKGLMISVIGEVLAGSLSGRGFQDSLNPNGRVGSAAGSLNAFLLVINPELTTGQHAYEAHLTDWITHFKANGGPDVRLPGERAAQAEQQACELGVPFGDGVADALRALGQSRGVPFPDPTSATQAGARH